MVLGTEVGRILVAEFGSMVAYEHPGRKHQPITVWTFGRPSFYTCLADAIRRNPQLRPVERGE